MSKKSSLRKNRKILGRVRSFRDHMAGLSDLELSGLTMQFKYRLERGESLDDLLPEAFAAICEADKRILGMDPFDSQVLGGIALHQGFLCEMNTGEGKTLVATLPMYLNALTGKSCILVTTNGYLASRDAEEMGPVYQFMGLTVAAGVTEDPDKQFTNDEKREIYKADIVYTTHGTLGFDYLFNNLVTAAEDRFMRELYYVIIDEADSVLLDGATMPLVISGAPRVQSNLYEMANFFVTTLQEDRDYELEDKKVWLTKEGIRYAEQFFQIDNFYGKEYFEINRHVTLALRAHTLFEIEKEYMVSEKGEITLLDNSSGRMMPGIKLRGGQHQALEVKESIQPSQENRSVASITYQNLFLLFEKMSGMSGTISDAAEELLNVYGTHVMIIPPNRPVQREDREDIYYQDKEKQFMDAIQEAHAVHARKQPVLIVVSTIGETEIVSKALIEKGIPHNVLNANNAYWEAQIIKEAGQLNAVTVATSMAGRGTDIKLGEGVRELGGLAVIGIGRMGSIRQERQARGRSGRQGDPGFSQFYVCLQDEVVLQNTSIALEKYLERGKRMGDGKLKRIINQAQDTGEEIAVGTRKQAMTYDQVLQRQRDIMYATRDNLLDGGVVGVGRLIEIARQNIREFVGDKKNRNRQSVSRYILDNISYKIDENFDTVNFNNRKELEIYLMEQVMEAVERQKIRLGDRDTLNQFIRLATLTSIDNAWVEQVDYLQQLQAAISGRAVAQRNLLFEYQKEGRESFSFMERTILQNVMRNVLLGYSYVIEVDGEEKLKLMLP